MELILYDLTTEYRQTPLGLDVPLPRFSWKLQAAENGTAQSSYMITVREPDASAVWQTGLVQSGQSHLVEYAGSPLRPKTKYTWEIAVQDNHGNTAQAESWFETGLMGTENLTARWITHGYEADTQPCPVFQRSFALPAGAKSAQLYASALGVYEATLNGSRVGDAFLAPGWTSYQSRIQYQTYDVTDLLGESNTLQLTVGNGWYKGELGFDSRPNIYGDRVAVVAQLEITLEDGSTLTIATDESWQYGTGQRRFSEIYHGETIDYTIETKMDGSASILEHPQDVLVAQENEPVRITQRVKPVQLITTPKGERVLDFGQNLVGVVEARLQAPRGTKIQLQHAEVLDKDGNFYTENLRTARATDTFVCSGRADVFLPAFTFHGFRYVKVEEMDAEPDLASFTACVLHTDMRQTGSFACSHRGITQLQSNIQWGQRGNFLDIPTDCPQRDERLGWTGDAQVFASTAAYNMNVALFFTKWLRDLAAEQSPEHGVPHVIPNILGDSEGAAAWSDAATIIPWTVYLTYGDTRILREQYQSMKGWVEYIRSKATAENLWQTGYQYADWLALDKEEGPSRTGSTDIYLVASAYYAYSTDIVAKAAALLGHSEDAAEYTALHDAIVEGFQDEYITPTGRMASETQTACILALYFGLAKPKDRKRILDTLVNNLAKHNNHLTTGFVGTPYLCHALSENGQHELAGKVFLKHDFPSWLYAVERGATTIWERWDSMKKDGSFDESGMNSFNHYAYGSIGSWMYQKLAGLQIVAPGYKKSRIAPMPIKGITWVEAAVETPYGRLAVEWRCENRRFTVDVEIPANTTATLCLPGGREEIEIGSGTYHYEYATGLELELDRYSLESTLGEILDNQLAVELLNQHMPGMTDNPMLNFVMDSSITELTALMPPEGKQLFEAVITALNTAQKEA